MWVAFLGKLTPTTITMNTSTIIDAVRRKVLEEGNEVVSDADILFHLQDTYHDTKKRTFSNSDIISATVNMVDGVGDLPDNFGTLYTDAKDAQNNSYKEVSLADFISRVAPKMVAIDGDTLAVYPTTPSALTIYYWPGVETLTTSSSLTLDEYFHYCVYLGTLSRVYGDLQDEELAQYYENKYDTELEKRISRQSGYEENNQQGGVLFNFQTLVPGETSPSNPNGFNF